ncbi:MAG TPA: hypothetical protein VJ859_09860 [Allosphingosinicella sp.]|nr:hypothetical protein [Allosphingosinicella sp.]
MVASAAKRDAAPVDVPPAFLFEVRAAQDSQAMLRIAGLFAQRNLVPQQISCRKSGGSLLMTIEIALDTASTAQLILQKIRSLVLVEHADLVELGDR